MIKNWIIFFIVFFIALMLLIFIPTKISIPFDELVVKNVGLAAILALIFALGKYLIKSQNFEDD